MVQVLKDTLKEDTLRGVALLIVLLAVCYLAVTNQAVPDVLVGLAGTIIGYYFGRGVTNGKASGNGTSGATSAISGHKHA